jgi:formate dehydrogenase subunit gamma
MKTVPYDREIASHIIAGFDARPEMLLQILVASVERFGWLPEEAIRQVADELNLSRAEVHGVVSYYHDLRTSPPGQHVVKVCAAEACQAMGGRDLAAHASRRLGQPLPSSTEALTLEPVYCLGNCACSPAVAVDGRIFGRVTPERFDQIVAETMEAGR